MGAENHTLLLRNHGLITAGPDCTWAFIRLLAFTRNAEVQLRAMSTGKYREYLPASWLKPLSNLRGVLRRLLQKIVIRDGLLFFT